MRPIVAAVILGALAVAPVAQAVSNPNPPANAIGPTASATGNMNLLCKETPALANALAANPTAGEAVVKAMCGQLGHPVAATASVGRIRWRAHVPALCVGAGCTYIWLSNLGGGWSYASYEALPYASYGYITGGRANFGRFTQSNGSTSGWGEGVYNDVANGWSGYRYIYPIAGTSNSWVEVNMNGWCSLSSGYVAGLGPVYTWNYITH